MMMFSCLLCFDVFKDGKGGQDCLVEDRRMVNSSVGGYQAISPQYLWEFGLAAPVSAKIHRCSSPTHKMV